MEADESYFDARQVRGKCGCGAYGKTIVFTPLKYEGKVYTVMVNDTEKSTLTPIISSKIKPDSIVYTDSCRSCDALDVSQFHHHHYRVNHSAEFAQGNNHINGIENFWSQAKRILRKYNGIQKDAFLLFLKECEFRFNYGSAKQQLEILRKCCEI